ncbi:hypothetical protein AB0M20_06555 [Actinoplanes sp. NPDC051633]|uniref:hypothetical protein n=1 Tax=Actinoplanes sp. NPDC051633 TaxID=3155670 RepID=UPI003436E654
MVFRLDWQGEFMLGGIGWIAVGHDDGRWWFDGYVVGKWHIDGGAPQVADLARWLLAERPAGRYEVEFELLRKAQPWQGTGEMLMDLDITLGRDEPGGPESLVCFPSGYLPKIERWAQIYEGLDWEGIDRPRLHAEATRLLESADGATA